MNSAEGGRVCERINAGLTATLRARHIIGRRVLQQVENWSDQMTLDIASPTGPVLLVNHLPAEMIALATSVLSRHLTISRQHAEDQLRSGMITLDRAIDAKTEDQMFALLGALGLSRKVDDGPNDLTLSVQLTAPDDLAYLAQKLAVIAQLDLATAQQHLQRPGGVILQDLAEVDVTRLRKQIRRHQGLKTTQSDTSALCDLFVTGPLSANTSRELGRYLALIGVTPCRFSGALASELTVQQVKQICARFPTTCVIGLDRAFQRFDLFLTGIGDLAPQDVAEFLSTRTSLSGAMVECVTPLKPLQIEKSLTRGVTQQFRADYASIGLQTCARLSGC